MIQRALLYLGTLLALAVAGAGAAQAQSFDFSYTSNGVAVMGIFDTVPTGQSGVYEIDNITNGTRGGAAIVLLGPGTVGNNNILYFPATSNPVSPGHYFDPQGFAYTTGTNEYDLRAEPPPTIYSEVTPGGGIALVDNLSVTPVPTPAPLPGGGLLSFLALGLAGLAYGMASMRAARRPA